MTTELAEKVLALHNNYRAQHGSTPLEWNEELAKGASENAQSLLGNPDTQLTFPEGAPESLKLGYNVFQYEAQGQGQVSDEEAVQEAVTSWYKSLANVESNNEDPPKGGNFLSNSTLKVGLGVARRSEDVEAGGATAIVVFAFYDPPGHFKDQPVTANGNSVILASTEDKQEASQSNEENEATTPTTIENTTVTSSSELEQGQTFTSESARLDVIIDPSGEIEISSVTDATIEGGVDGSSAAAARTEDGQELVALIEQNEDTPMSDDPTNEIMEKVETVEENSPDSNYPKTVTITTTTLEGKATEIGDIAVVISNMLKEAAREDESLTTAERNQTTTITATIKGTSDDTSGFESALRNALASSGVTQVKITTGPDLISTVEVTALNPAAVIVAHDEAAPPVADTRNEDPQPIETVQDSPAAVLLETALDQAIEDNDKRLEEQTDPVTPEVSPGQGLDLISTEEELIDVEAIPIIVNEVLKKTEENLAPKDEQNSDQPDPAVEPAAETTVASNVETEQKKESSISEGQQTKESAIEASPEETNAAEEPKVIEEIVTTTEAPIVTSEGQQTEPVPTTAEVEPQKISEEISTRPDSIPGTQEDEPAADPASEEEIKGVESSAESPVNKEESQPAPAETPAEVSTPVPEPVATIMTKGMLEDLAQVLNEYRRKHGAPSLKIEPKLTDEAKHYATSILMNKPDDALLGKLDAGKNVYYFEGPAGADNLVAVFRTAVESWYSTVEGFVWTAPITSTPESQTFCQLVWASSRKISIGSATQGSKGVIVVLYAPGANFTVEKNFRANVRPDFS